MRQAKPSLLIARETIKNFLPTVVRQAKPSEPDARERRKLYSTDYLKEGSDYLKEGSDYQRRFRLSAKVQIISQDVI